MKVFIDSQKDNIVRYASDPKYGLEFADEDGNWMTGCMVLNKDIPALIDFLLEWWVEYGE